MSQGRENAHHKASPLRAGENQEHVFIKNEGESV